MTCRDVQRRLEEARGGRPTSAPRGPLLRHLARCAACRELQELFEAASEREIPDALLEGVLQQTSGPACRQAWDRLPDHVDGALGPLDRELVGQHLEHCPACTELAITLTRLTSELGAMAELDPGPGFVEQVRRRTHPTATVPAAPRSRRGWWRRLVDRPRIAWEAAYVAAALTWLLFGPPHLPAQSVAMATVGVVDLGKETWSEVATLSEASLSDLRLDARGVGDRVNDRGRALGRQAWRRIRAEGLAGLNSLKATTERIATPILETLQTQTATPTADRNEE